MAPGHLLLSLRPMLVGSPWDVGECQSPWVSLLPPPPHCPQGQCRPLDPAFLPHPGSLLLALLWGLAAPGWNPPLGAPASTLALRSGWPILI